jgi:pimeloyl-ACP methyl ester carboxylesterase
MFDEDRHMSPARRVDAAARALAPLALACLLTAGPVRAEDAAGRWAGQLPAPVGLHIVVTLEKSADGRWTGALISPDQSPKPFPATSVEADTDHLKFSLTDLQLSYEAHWDGDSQAWVGVFSQGGASFPLSLKRQAPEAGDAGPIRPQEAAIAASAKPFHEETARFDNPAAPGVQLAGTLTMPSGAGPFPAVVLIAGSGRQTRDEVVDAHQIFLVLADRLARRGLAVLRYDKRGVGDSSGDYRAATSADFASDTEAALTWLRGRREIDARRIGLIGHSEGAEIAPMVAARDRRVAFIVMLAAPGVPGRMLLAEQTRLIDESAGEPVAEGDREYAINRRVYDAIAAAADPAAAESVARALMNAASPAPPPEAVEETAKLARSAWMRFFLSYDPAPTLARVRAPILVLNGSKDLQVPPAIDLPPIRAALAHRSGVDIIEMPGLNHLFQHAVTGSPAEYAQIQETLSPELLDTLTDWVGKQVK